LSTDTVVGLLTLLGLVYIAYMQSGLRTSQIQVNDASTLGHSAEAVSQLTTALMQAVEALASRDSLIADLRGRIEVLEENDRQKTLRILGLEQKLAHIEAERDRLLAERDHLAKLVKNAS